MFRLFAIVATALFLTLPSVSSAEAVPYRLQSDRSEVGFIYTLSGSANRGSMPVKSADIRIDFDRFTNSTADVTVNVASARTGLIFATEALK